MATTADQLFTIPGEGILRADAAASYLRMRADGMPAGGVAVFLRSLAKQEALYRAYKAGGPVAARPTPNAPHVRGVAMDLTTGGAGPYRPSAAHKWLTAGGTGRLKPQPGEKPRAHRYGWRRTVPSERWHFAYDRRSDSRRAADLRTRLKALGFAKVEDFQVARGLKKDGVDGPRTWRALLTVGGVVPTPERPAVRFSIGAVGLSAATALDDVTAGSLLGTRLACSVYALTGAPEATRDVIRAALGGSEQWLVYPIGDSTVLWQAKRWLHTGRADVRFGSSDASGAVRAQLERRPSGRKLDVIVVQSRPVADFASGQDAVAAQAADLRSAMASLRRRGVPTVVAGQLGDPAAAEVLAETGLTRVRTVGGDPASTGHQVWLSAGLALRSASGVDDPGASGPAWRVKLTLPKA